VARGKQKFCFLVETGATNLEQLRDPKERKRSLFLDVLCHKRTAKSLKEMECKVFKSKLVVNLLLNGQQRYFRNTFRILHYRVA